MSIEITSKLPASPWFTTVDVQEVETKLVRITETSLDKVESIIHCKDCNTKITIIGRRKARFCSYCGKEGTPE